MVSSPLNFMRRAAVEGASIMRPARLVALVLVFASAVEAQSAQHFPLPTRPAPPPPPPAPPVAARPAPVPSPWLTDPALLRWKREVKEALAREKAERLRAEQERDERALAERLRAARDQAERDKVEPVPAQCAAAEPLPTARAPKNEYAPVDAGAPALDSPIYHWVDAEGVEHFSDEPGPTR